MKKNIYREYDQDFYIWTLHNAKLLREGKLSEIDVEHLAEEIESMGKSQRRELINRLALLIAHLLKWKFQPLRRSRSWALTIKNQRMDLNELLEESPSLKKELEDKFKYAYKKAVILAAGETGMDETDFPSKPPFALKDCLKASFLPH